jgi:hypothetical protein
MTEDDLRAVQAWLCLPVATEPTGTPMAIYRLAAL